ncbi:MAG: hypothetical protein PHS59_05650 [Paludibacter sp.]|nr:hypothetical protein [Paludibacter sp.]
MISKIQIQLTGVAAELVLGNYMPKDSTIFNNWEDFFHYNDVIHESQLLVEYISNIQIMENEQLIFSGSIPALQLRQQKSFIPVLQENSLYLRTECAERAVYQTVFEVENFDKMKLFFETQDYDLLFKVGNSFLSKVIYDDKVLNNEWKSGKPVGNICLLCRCENGFLVPLYDAIKKLSR